MPSFLLPLLLACTGAPSDSGTPADADTDIDGATDTDGATDSGDPLPLLGPVTVSLDDDTPIMLWVEWTLNADVDAVWLTFLDADGEWRSSPERAGTPGPHDEVVLGLPQDTATTVRIMARVDGVDELLHETSARTGLLFDSRLEPTEISWDPGLASDAPYLFGSVEVNSTGYYWGPFTLFVADRQGRIVWYRRLDGETWTLFPQLSRDGTHVVYERGRFVGVFDGAETFVDRRTLSGRYHEVTEMDALGFSFWELPDGSLLYDDYSDWPQVWLTEVAPDGARRQIWECFDWIGDRCASEACCSPNAVKWDEETDTVLWSLFDSHTVVRVDRPTGEVVASWGQLDGSWAFDPPDSNFDKQHWPELTADGTLLISTHTVDGAEQRWREFSLDEDTQTLHQIWSYGDADAPFAEHHGEAVRLANGNTLGNFGSGGVVREVTPDGQTAWELQWSQPFMLGHQELIDDLYALDRGP
ncbi:MAG: hypothetical protein H6742_21780 [Alphaproteobacteria bacterium]|nr:hypothetical protein [Alphaproteobacteria bacterium]